MQWEQNEAAVLVETQLSPRGIPLVHLSGDIDMHVCPGIREALHKLLDQGHSTLVLDMSRVNYIDSAGLGILLGVLRRVQQAGGAMLLAGMNPFVRHSFEITSLNRVFGLHESVSAALETIR